MAEIFLGKYNDNSQASIPTNMLTRHGLIAGATGTGKTITLKVLVERLSKQGIPSVVCDIKGDLSGLVEKGTDGKDLSDRIKELEPPNYEDRGFPVEFFDIFGQKGIPLRTTISDIGPLLLAQILGLNQTQEGILNIIFKIADDLSLLLYNIDDLRAMLQFVSENATEFGQQYGRISTSSVQAIIRSLLVLEEQGGDHFFNEPPFDIQDFFRKNDDNEGYINIIQAYELFQQPTLYASFLLWLLAEIYEKSPEKGDVEQPDLVFFFDEAHLIYKNNNKKLQEKIELITRLIRSKGISIFFITQNPTDLSTEITSQLGHKIQHGMRAFSGNDQKKIKSIADSFRTEDKKQLIEDIIQLKVGDAIISTLESNGIPTIAKICHIYPPMSKIGTIELSNLNYLINHSELYDKYYETINSYSAYEALNDKKNQSKNSNPLLKDLLNQTKINIPTGKIDKSIERLTNNILGQMGREIGRMISRNIFGTRKK